MMIEKNSVVAFSYILRDDQGLELERNDAGAPMVYLQGHRNIMPALEVEMAGKSVGDQFSVTLAPEKAYGLRQNLDAKRVPIKHIVSKHKKLKAGMAVKVNTAEGAKDVVIIKVGKFNVDVDSNHPLAGKTITFDITIKQIREAYQDEITHGHSHGMDGNAGHSVD